MNDKDRDFLEILHGILEALEDIHEDLQALKPKPIVASSRAVVTLGAPTNQ